MMDNTQANALIQDLAFEAPNQPLEYYVEGLKKLTKLLPITYDQANALVLQLRNQ